MKRNNLALIATLFFVLVSVVSAQAQYTRAQIKSRLSGLGMSPELTAEVGNLLTGQSIHTGNLTFGSSTGGIIHTVGTLAAAGSVQGDAAAITAKVTTVSAADGTKGVILPATPAVGAIYQVINTVAAVLKIYPGSGDAINATAANTAVSIAASVPVYCIATSTAQWWCSEGTAP